MLISSCRFDCLTEFADIVRKKHSVEITFERKAPFVTPLNQVSTTDCTTNIAVNADANGCLVTDNNGLLPVGVNQIGAINQYTSNTFSNTPETLGYRLFFLNGYLKCVKKEIKYVTIGYHSVSLGPTIKPHREIVKQKNYTETFCHPYVVLNSLCNSFGNALAAKKYLQGQVILMSQRYGIKIPDSFGIDADNGLGEFGTCYFAALDWFAYPLIRELDCPVLSRNMDGYDRDYISPRFGAMNFKQLIQYYYKSSTPKLLESIWSCIALGPEFFRNEVACGEKTKVMLERLLEGRDATTIVSKDENGFVSFGNKRLNHFLFNLGPVILKTMGYDYFYQAIDIMRKEDFVTNVTAIYGLGRDTEEEIKFLLKYVTPKKLLTAILSSKMHNVFLHLKDTAVMLKDYDTPEKIPANLRSQYPKGLVIDFNFKTLKELHDKVSTQFTIIKSEASKKEIPVAEVYAKLDGRKSGNLSLVVPTNTAMLSVWGKLLNICVASYGDRAAEGNTLLLGVEESGIPKYCIEFRSVKAEFSRVKMPAGLYDPSAPPEVNIERTVEYYPQLLEKHVSITPMDTPPEDEICHIPYMVQFRGSYNSDPSQEDRNAVENLLIEWCKENIEFLGGIKGIFNSNTYFGEGGILGADMINNAVNVVVNNYGRPEQIIANPYPNQQAVEYNPFRAP